MSTRPVYLNGLGTFSPGEQIPFDQIEQVLGVIQEAPPRTLRWIQRIRPIFRELLGIKYAHYAIDPATREPTETSVTMAVKAAQIALDRAGIAAQDIDLIVYGYTIPEMTLPPTTTLIQEALQIPHCAEYSIHSACSSIYKALQLGTEMLASGKYKNALVLTSQLISPLLRAEYFNQQALTQDQIILRWFLCDAAGAAVLTSQKPSRGALQVKHTYVNSDGMGRAPVMTGMAGGTRVNPLDVYANGWHHLSQRFDAILDIGTPLFRNGLREMVKETGLDMATVRCFFANLPTKHFMDHCIDGVRADFRVPQLQFYSRLGDRGYPGPPAILIALDEYLQENELIDGDKLVSFVTESSKWMHAGFLLEYHR